MGVYIPNLEIPTSCFDCPVSHPALGNLGAAILGCPLIGKTLSAPFCEEKRMDNCPLVPVPPHGRLVDMGEIEERIDSCCDDIDCSKTMCNECAVQIVMDKVFDAPTVIPAEEGET